MKKTRRRENETAVRREEILDCALDLAVRIGYQNITRDLVAAHAHVSTGLVSWYFMGIHDLKKEIVKTAIDREILPILSQCLALQDPQVKDIKPGLKTRIISFLYDNN